MSARGLSMAGLTIEKVGHTDPVSYTGHTPSGSTRFPSRSKHAVTIRYVPSLSSSVRREERVGSTLQVQLHLVDRVTNAHSVTPFSSHVSGTTIRAS